MRTAARSYAFDREIIPGNSLSGCEGAQPFNGIQPPEFDRRLAKDYAALVCGVDEAGRGCLAGPIFAGCVILREESRVEGIKDSKLLAPRIRETLADIIRREALAYGIAAVDADEIDRYGIEWANREVFTLAVHDLLRRFPEIGRERVVVLVDGNREPLDMPFPWLNLVRGDRQSAAVAAASILAKTARDRYVCDILHKAFPHFGFDKHKGYPTSLHREALARWGPTPFHRKSFRLFPQRSFE